MDEASGTTLRRYPAPACAQEKRQTPNNCVTTLSVTIAGICKPRFRAPSRASADEKHDRKPIICHEINEHSREEQRGSAPPHDAGRGGAREDANPRQIEQKHS